MKTEVYTSQLERWPKAGCHILAQFDEETIVVYQAYRPAIAGYAVAHQRFGGEFSYTRMSWIKPNFLWMMYRAGWATKEGQERILAVRLKRGFFDWLLENAVPSGFDATRFASREEWQERVARSDVRLQWDPDHAPDGRPVERRALQLGLRGDALRRYGEAEVVSIEDITPFVQEQRLILAAGANEFRAPSEDVYAPSPPAALNVGVDRWDP
jgi:hypothetical protein